MNETGTTSSAFEAGLDAKDRDILTFMQSNGLADHCEIIDGKLFISKEGVLRLCRIVNTEKSAAFERWIKGGMK